jgi:hypothetical protein
VVVIASDIANPFRCSGGGDLAPTRWPSPHPEGSKRTL